mmetsp:Transcript_13360/g.21001  ORF Transcript_13360/g.21001 Transcript_13360/m.21001 type:complete len:103 (+) Transcript_13360:1866-2174(+)
MPDDGSVKRKILFRRACQNVKRRHSKTIYTWNTAPFVLADEPPAGAMANDGSKKRKVLFRRACQNMKRCHTKTIFTVVVNNTLGCVTVDHRCNHHVFELLDN